jgi:hypothetical protein
MKAKALLLAGALLVSSAPVAHAQGILFEPVTNQFGSIALSDMTDPLGTIGTTTITSTQSELASFDGIGSSKGHDLGRFNFTTGVLSSGSASGGGVFSGTGSSITIVAQGEWLASLPGAPTKGRVTLFTGNFVGDITWTLVSKVGAKLTYTLSGNVAGVLWDGSSVTGTTTQNIFTSEEQLAGGVAHISVGDSSLTPYVNVTIPANNSIQEDLIDTFPLGTFKADNQLATLFEIPSTPKTCGYNGLGPCNFYDAFGFDGDGQSITIDVSIPNVAHVFTLMNAYMPAAGQQLATIEFFGSDGATETFPLVAGQDIRDFYQGSFANTLTNGIPGVNAVNAFSCVDPTTCLGGGGTGNVTTGDAGIYVIDEQQFSLSPAFSTQDLVKIVITDTYDGSDPILLGITTD